MATPIQQVRGTCGDQHDKIERRLEWGTSQFETLISGQQETHRAQNEILSAIRGDVLGESGGLVGQMSEMKGHLERIETHVTASDNRFDSHVQHHKDSRANIRTIALAFVGAAVVAVAASWHTFFKIWEHVNK